MRIHELFPAYSRKKIKFNFLVKGIDNIHGVKNFTKEAVDSLLPFEVHFKLISGNVLFLLLFHLAFAYINNMSVSFIR